MSESQLRAERKNIGMIFQHFNLLSSRTVAENIAFPLELVGASKDVIHKKSRIPLGTGRPQRPRRQLSVPALRRPEAARRHCPGPCQHPKILLCDEATSALDPQTTKSILELLQDINQRLGITIVIITHEMAVVQNICHRAAVIEGGVIKELGRVVDIFTNPQSQTMKDFVTSVINMELPKGIKNLGVSDQPTPDRDMLVRLRFKGQATHEPVVSEIVSTFHVKVSVLYGNIDYIQDEPFGYLIIVIMGDMETQAKAFSYIKTLPIGSEVLGYVPRNH